MKTFLSIILLTFVSYTYSQDTLTVMQYNLLNYGNYTSYCSVDNNSHEQKDVYLRTIIDYVEPEIFTVNEISQYEFYHDGVLSEILNTGERDYYQRAQLTNMAGSYILNELFYDSRKLVLHSQAVLQSYVRDINLYTLYYRSPRLILGDTVFVNCIVTHLKSSSGSENEAARAAMTASAMLWLKMNSMPGNYLFMGDFNVYSSDEVAYQNLVAPVPGQEFFRFYDPIDQPGNWHNSSAFSSCHTQSVSSTGNGCQASGGMDDRFDFILASGSLMFGTKGARYIDDSYHAFGQDGLHFNKSITDSPVNQTVPADVLSALGSMSDHLPVILKLEIPDGVNSVANVGSFSGYSVMKTADGAALLRLFSKKAAFAEIRIISITGSVIGRLKIHVNEGENKILLPCANLSSGLYLLNLEEDNGNQFTIKLVL